MHVLYIHIMKLYLYFLYLDSQKIVSCCSEPGNLALLQIWVVRDLSGFLYMESGCP